jgi:hypothetical protein
MTNLQPQIKEFIKSAQKEYYENTVLKQVSKWQEYEGQDLEYTQVGRLVGIEKEIFDQNPAGHGIFVRDFTKPIWEGEKLAVIDEIERTISKDSKTELEDDLTYEAFISTCRTCSADHAFIPIKRDLWDTVHDWHHNGKGEYIDHNQYITTGKNNVRIHWLPSDRGLDSIYFLNSKKLSIIQKRGENSELPAQIKSRITNEMKEINQDEFLMTYVVEGEGEKYDILQRVVLWMNLDQGGASYLDVTQSDE